MAKEVWFADSVYMYSNVFKSYKSKIRDKICCMLYCHLTPILDLQFKYPFLHVWVSHFLILDLVPIFLDSFNQASLLSPNKVAVLPLSKRYCFFNEIFLSTEEQIDAHSILMCIWPPLLLPHHLSSQHCLGGRGVLLSPIDSWGTEILKLWSHFIMWSPECVDAPKLTLI